MDIQMKQRIVRTNLSIMQVPPLNQTSAGIVWSVSSDLNKADNKISTTGLGHLDISFVRLINGNSYCSFTKFALGCTISNAGSSKNLGASTFKNITVPAPLSSVVRNTTLTLSIWHRTKLKTKKILATAECPGVQVGIEVYCNATHKMCSKCQPLPALCALNVTKVNWTTPWNLAQHSGIASIPSPRVS